MIRRMHTRFIVLVAAAAVLAPSGGHAGGTFELSLGGGAVQHRDEADRITTRAAFAGPSFSVGWKHAPKVAVIGRIAIHFPGDTLVHYGAGLQYWPIDHVFLAATAGVALLDYKQVQPPNITGRSGFGLDLRIGYNLFPEYRHTIHVALAVSPALLVGPEVTIPIALQIAYQYF
jgi:hypothetical protein